ncbi:Phosphatase PHOSPHO-type [Corchorus olitorius]|uniref:Phosphatase PHOSPHO-type n=1 Tax=Corchorus olitorius TaxID=93759 RepID=A0A1R3HFC0_9ROSI|nr:Phosphatase PHOSPHO-type [Corchorus olitorius]
MAVGLQLVDFQRSIQTKPFVGEVRLGMFPYHDSNSSPHGCSLCPTNLYKTLVLDGIDVSAPEG